MSELEDLIALLEEDNYCLYEKGDISDGFEVVDSWEGDERRWVITECLVIKTPSGKYYQFSWDRGKTEYQENDYDWSQYEEVTPVEKIVTTVEWVKATP